MSGTNGTTPVTVSGATSGKRAGEARHGQPRAEPTVWTDRMLTALEQGVKGGIWFSLVDKVYDERNLRSAAAEVAARGYRGLKLDPFANAGRDPDAKLVRGAK